MLLAHKKAPAHSNRMFFIITRLSVAMEFVCVAHINVYASHRLPLSWVTVHATQAAQCAIWVPAIRARLPHPVREHVWDLWVSSV